MSLFKPFMLKKSITCISVETLQAWGIKAVLLDVDNTLTAHDSQQLPQEVTAWLEAVQAVGIIPMIISNGKRARIRPFAEKLGLPFTAMAAKPLPFGFWRAKKQCGLKRWECMVIGDQIFTDVWGGKLAGIRVIQVLPRSPETDKPFIRFKRKLERRIMKSWEVQT